MRGTCADCITPLAGTVLIAVTRYGQEQDIHKTREAGFDHYLVKPVDMEALRRLLAHSGRDSHKE